VGIGSPAAFRSVAFRSFIGVSAIASASSLPLEDCTNLAQYDGRVAKTCSGRRKKVCAGRRTQFYFKNDG
jgi:hypothetical protein